MNLKQTIGENLGYTEKAGCCDKCGYAFDFPFEWCVCGLCDGQRVQLEQASAEMIAATIRPSAR